MHTLNDQIKILKEHQNNFINIHYKNPFAQTLYNIQNAAIKIQEEVHDQCPLDIKLDHLAQIALMLLSPPGNESLKEKARACRDEIKNLLPHLANQQQVKSYTVLLELISFFENIHKEFKREYLLIKTNLIINNKREKIKITKTNLINKASELFIVKYPYYSFESIKYLIMIVFKAWNNFPKNILDGSFFKEINHPIAQLFYHEYFYKIFGIYRLYKFDNLQKPFIESIDIVMNDFFGSDIKKIKLFMDFSIGISEASNFFSMNFNTDLMEYKKKLLKVHQYHQFYLEEVNNRIKIKEIQSDEFIKELTRQDLIRRKSLKPVSHQTTSPAQKPRKSNAPEKRNQTPTSNPEDIAYELFKNQNFREAIRAYTSLKEEKVTKQNRLKHVRILASIGDCYNYWSRFEFQKKSGGDKLGLELEKKAISFYTQALEQITVGAKQNADNEEWRAWSYFINESLHSLRPQNYWDELKKEVEKQETALTDANKNTSSLKKTAKLPAKTSTKKLTFFDAQHSLVSNNGIVAGALILNPTSLAVAQPDTVPSKKKRPSPETIVNTIKNSIPPPLQAIIDELHQRNHRCYIVGGAVTGVIADSYVIADSDKKVEQVPTDIDIVTTAIPQEIREIAEKRGYTVQIIGTRKPIARIQTGPNPEEHYDFATLEGTSPQKKLHYVTLDNGLVVPIFSGTDIKEDAQNRDVPVNAMYLNLLTDEIEDPTGEGWASFDRNELSTIGNPLDSFRTDAVRMLRIVRLAVKLNFSIEEQTKQTIRQCASFEIEPPMRLLQELHKLLINKKAIECFNLLNQFQLLSLLKKEQANVELIPQILSEITFYNLSDNEAWLLLLATLFWPGISQHGSDNKELIEQVDNTLNKFKRFLWENIRAKIRQIWLQALLDQLVLPVLNKDELSLIPLFKKIIQTLPPTMTSTATSSANFFMSSNQQQGTATTHEHLKSLAS
ncbi:CCA tRNA nucleotidyltransferase [Legionella fairfieldensis]|uniref:CCA tRNA nucleotidyltransferase n=1 Tax=Legionella fairfieldensis TaxID=45064 RepID=UPI00048C0A66|nr:CCA tRNA nucleotidyltransferase [Legionella fairfieldensis]